MNRHEIAFLAEALDQIARIRTWWLEQRHAAPTLFDEELLATLARLAEAPGTGALYQRRGSKITLRRVLMPRTHYHVYYTVDAVASVVAILAVWHATRGHGPRL